MGKPLPKARLTKVVLNQQLARNRNTVVVRMVCRLPKGRKERAALLRNVRSRCLDVALMASAQLKGMILKAVRKKSLLFLALKHSKLPNFFRANQIMHDLRIRDEFS